MKQAAVADRLVLTKTDLIDTPERAAAQDTLIDAAACAQSGRADARCRQGEAAPRRCSIAGSTSRLAKSPMSDAGWRTRLIAAAQAQTIITIMT